MIKKADGIMDYLYLSYYSNDMPKEELELFFEYQEAIKEDCKRIKYMISDYENTKQKKRLIQFWDLIGSNIVKSRFKNLQEELLGQELNICLNYNYVIFSFFLHDDNEEICSDTPTIGIMARDMSMVCCIEEEYSVFSDDEEDCEFNRGYDTVFCFTIDKKEKTIEEYQTDMEEYTISLFQKAFHNPESIVENKDKVLIKYE